MKIGTFALDSNGVLHGRIYGLGLGAVSVVFDPQISKDNKEYFRLIADPAREAYEIGVAFPKEKNGAPYHSVSIESPVLAVPINAALFPDKENTGTYNLVWNRIAAPGLKATATFSAGDNPQHARQFATPHVN